MKILATTALVTLIGAPVFAGGLNPVPADNTVYQPAPLAPIVANADWTGGYVGANLSYGFIDGDNNDGNPNNDGTSNGAVGGIYGGYLYDFGRFVLGGELGLNAADLEFNGGTGQIDRLHTAKLKAGVDMGRTLAYGTLGAAYAEGTLNGAQVDDTGWLVGAGVDYMLTEQVSVGGEVTYHKFDDFANTGVDFDTTTVAANVALRF